jgi:hypothetical protein
MWLMLNSCVNEPIPLAGIDGIWEGHSESHSVSVTLQTRTNPQDIPQITITPVLDALSYSETIMDTLEIGVNYVSLTAFLFNPNTGNFYQLDFRYYYTFDNIQILTGRIRNYYLNNTSNNLEVFNLRRIK